MCTFSQAFRPINPKCLSFLGPGWDTDSKIN